ncbi:nucleotidyltransferase domain-containing protein [bacterium]|nr:nucleotidyltransferase domain-containing protein [bacterium]MBU1754160.1 nucleotidyltransferase domain-containing protein [bacterium]
MRMLHEQVDILKKEITAILPDAIVYLFGSRVDDNKKGGDIDIMILSNRKINWKEKAIIRWHYFGKFGEQKLDIISFTFKEETIFKQIVLQEGIRL